MSDYKPSANLFKLLKHYEGVRLQAYADATGTPTIGYGSTFYLDGSRVKMGDSITQEQAEALLPAIVNKFAHSVNTLTKRELKQCEFDALVDFAYNAGIGNLQTSTLLQRVNQNATADVITKEFLRWQKSKGVVLRGLTFRRQSEVNLYVTGEVVFYN